MVLFKGRSSMKQYMPQKPTKRGCKLWCLCDSHNGLLYKVIVYTGAATGSARESGEGGLGARVVRALVEPLNRKGYHIYFDNYFSSVSLAMEQASKGNYTIVTTRPNQRGWPASLNDIQTLQKGMARGDTRSEVVGGGTVQCLIWKDKKGIPILNCIANPDETTTVLWRNKDGTRATVACPLSVKLYNTFMGGVDLFDVRHKTYSASRKSKKWWFRLFYFLLDTAMVNSYIIYAETVNKRLTLKEYALKVVSSLMSARTSRQRHRITQQGPPAARFCERHFLAKQEERHHCMVCRKAKTVFCCSDCNPTSLISLCPIPCFKVYHTKN